MSSWASLVLLVCRLDTLGAGWLTWTNSLSIPDWLLLVPVGVSGMVWWFLSCEDSIVNWNVGIGQLSKTARAKYHAKDNLILYTCQEVYIESSIVPFSVGTWAVSKFNWYIIRTVNCRVAVRCIFLNPVEYRMHVPHVDHGNLVLSFIPALASVHFS